MGLWDPDALGWGRALWIYHTFVTFVTERRLGGFLFQNQCERGFLGLLLSEPMSTRSKEEMAVVSGLSATVY